MDDKNLPLSPPLPPPAPTFLPEFDFDAFGEAAKYMMRRMPARAHDMVRLAREIDALSDQQRADFETFKIQMDTLYERWQVLFGLVGTIAQLIRATASFTGNKALWPADEGVGGGSDSDEDTDNEE